MLPTLKDSTWRTLWKKNLTQWEALADFLELDEAQREKLLKKSRFPLNLPWRLAEKVEKGTLDDPILKQFLPLKEELKMTEGFCSDPVGDQTFSQSSKLIKKYHGRALLLVSSACAMHCRYCFRQNYPYEKELKSFEKELELIHQDPTLEEIILSGGDPLSLSDEKLEALFFQLAAIPHVKRLRIHTRFPLALPERIDDSFLALVEGLTLPLTLVLHANHPRELDAHLFAHLDRLREKKVTLLNQAVLLKGVNDSVASLETLFLTLADHGILPYYLHQLDRVQGASHFEVDLLHAKRLYTILRERLPGYALPRFVQEVSGDPSKRPLL